MGALAVAQHIGALLLERGASLTLQSSYDDGVFGPVHGLRALSADGTKSTLLSLQPSTGMISSFLPETAQLRIDALSLSLPLGSYGAALLASIRQESASGGQAPAIEAAAGCAAVFGPWWSKSTLASVCEASVAVAACETALTDLTTRIDTQLKTLDLASASVLLSGYVPVQDRTEDGQVDDLGPADLTGSWGSDSALGAIRVPVATAFAR